MILLANQLPCGCRLTVELEEETAQPLIAFCSIHADALDLDTACRELVASIDERRSMPVKEAVNRTGVAVRMIRKLMEGRG